MEQVELIVEQREDTKKTANNRLRREGFIPAVVYHKGDPSQALKVGAKDFYHVLHTEAGRNVLINLSIKGDQKKKKRTVVIKEIQSHPVSGDSLHVDFHEISLKEKIKVMIPILEKGEAVGVKAEGGVLEFPIREIEVECLPTDIPEHIEVNIENLKLNEAIHIKDLELPKGVDITQDPDTVILHITPPHVEKEPEPTGEEGAEEPEVIGEKKEEGAEGEAAPESKEEAPKEGS